MRVRLGGNGAREETVSGNGEKPCQVPFLLPKKVVHLSPIFVSSSRTSIVSGLLQTAAGSKGQLC